MASLDISDAEFADLLDVSVIDLRLAHGSLMTTIGRHPELGAFVVIQTAAALGREFVLVTSAEEDLMFEVVDDWGRISGADFARINAAQLDRLERNGEG